MTKKRKMIHLGDYSATHIFLIIFIIYSGTLGIWSPMGQTKLAVLRGDRISKGFFTRKIKSGWAAKKKSGGNDEVTVLPRWP